LDPTVSNGSQLWRGHGNFHPVPWPDSDHNHATRWPKWESPRLDDTSKRGFFEDFIYWARQPGLSALELGDVPKEHLPILVLLHLIGSEWLTMCEYIKTRLNQIDMETIDPAHFSDKKHIDAALEKLHMWRRFIPLYREMISETLQHVFNFSCTEFSTGRAQNPPSAISEPSAAARRCPHPSNSQTTGSLRTWDIKAYEEDYKLVLARLEEYQSRIDRLTSVVTAVMAVEDTRRAITDARNIGFLTWLATFFIPFGVFSGIFSMQKLEDMSLGTIRLYFAVTLPFVFVTLVIAWTLHTAIWHKWFSHA
jgi:Mg2+ and Co2+ transporter CorA